MKEQPVIIFDKVVNTGVEVHWSLVRELSEYLSKDDYFEVEDFLSIPNATKAGIKKLHDAHIARRKALK